MIHEHAIVIPDESTSESKRAIRADIRLKRRSVFNQFGMEYAEDIANHFVKHIPLMPQSVISAYWPIRSEVNIEPLMEKLVRNGHFLCLPCVATDGKSLVFRRYRLGDILDTGPYSLPQPMETSEEMQPYVLVVPMLAFSREGNRLGYGKGFYDRTIRSIRKEKPITVIGIAFSDQEVDSIPTEEHDQVMDWIITEKEVIRIKK